MRLAFSGAHRTGKTTLIEAVAALRAGYEVVEEPYRLLEEEGYEFADPPSQEDFEAQLRRSIEAVAAAPAWALFDRCPLDLVAYLRALDPDYDASGWLPELREAMASIDRVVVLSIETPDRIAIPSSEDRHLRLAVDELIRTLVLDDAYGLDVVAVEVQGSLDERIRQVMRALR